MALNILALAGGVGGAKLLDGLARVLPAGSLSAVVNIGDDFNHYGLHIAPDLDTVMYTLSGWFNPQTGWGVRDESWQTLDMLTQYGEAPWFRLGDRDMATHILRRHLLEQGWTLTQITTHLCANLGIKQHLLPASDDRCATMLDTVEAGTLAFQDYFVRQGWQPTVTRIWYDGNAQPTPQVHAAFENADAIIICPSNPFLSIDPILTLGDLREKLQKRRVPCIAVSPLIKGQAVKGPAHKIMGELGHDASNDGIMAFYQSMIDVLVVDHGDQPNFGAYHEAAIMMHNKDDKMRLAQTVLQLAGVQ